MCIAFLVIGTMSGAARGSIESDVLNACNCCFVLMHIRLAHQAHPFSQPVPPSISMRLHLCARLHLLFWPHTRPHRAEFMCTGYILDGGQCGNDWLAYWLEITCEVCCKKMDLLRPQLRLIPFFVPCDLAMRLGVPMMLGEKMTVCVSRVP